MPYTETCVLAKGSVVTDANGNKWDLASPGIIGVKTANAGASTVIVTDNGVEIVTSVSFVDGVAAFEETRV